jgi:hypothetical protein
MIDIHLFTDQTTNTIVKEALKLCTKLVKHLRSLPTINIQHGFLAKNIF